MILYIESYPIPSNGAYATRVTKSSSYRFMKTDYRDWCDDVTESLQLQLQSDPIVLPDNKVLKLSIVIMWNAEEIYTKNGKVRKKDLSGHLKLLEDCLARALNIDDSYNFVLSMYKVPTDKPTRMLLLLNPITVYDVQQLAIREIRLHEDI